MTALLAAVLSTALLVAGCSQAISDEQQALPAPRTNPTETPQPEETPESVTIGDRPDWAVNPVDLGKLAGEQHGDVWNAQVFRVGTAATTSDGIWEMPGTREPVIPMGTVMTVYNVVFTNTSEDWLILDASATAAGVTLIHRGVEEFKASLPSYDPEMTVPFGLSPLPFDPLQLDLAPQFGERPGLLVAPGESFAIPINTWSTPGEIEVAAFVNVMDEDGTPLAEKSELLTFTITQ